MSKKSRIKNSQSSSSVVEVTEPYRAGDADFIPDFAMSEAEIPLSAREALRLLEEVNNAVVKLDDGAVILPKEITGVKAAEKVYQDKEVVCVDFLDLRRGILDTRLVKAVMSETLEKYWDSDREFAPIGVRKNHVSKETWADMSQKDKQPYLDFPHRVVFYQTGLDRLVELGMPPKDSENPDKVRKFVGPFVVHKCREVLASTAPRSILKRIPRDLNEFQIYRQIWLILDSFPAEEVHDPRWYAGSGLEPFTSKKDFLDRSPAITSGGLWALDNNIPRETIGDVAGETLAKARKTAVREQQKTAAAEARKAAQKPHKAEKIQEQLPEPIQEKLPEKLTDPGLTMAEAVMQAGFLAQVGWVIGSHPWLSFTMAATWAASMVGVAIWAAKMAF